MDSDRLEFRATGGECAGFLITRGLLTVVTCGIYGFWLASDWKKWCAQRTYVHGEPLAYKTGFADFVLNQIVKGTLMLVTCGLYLPWAMVKGNRYDWRHMTVADGRTCRFDGGGSAFVGITLLGALVSLCTCGLGSTWAYAKGVQWNWSHTLIGGERVRFEGRPGDLFLKGLGGHILSTITCGLYLPWHIITLERWRIENAFVVRGTDTTPTPPDPVEAMLEERAKDPKTWIGLGIVAAALLLISLVVSAVQGLADWVSTWGDEDEVALVVPEPIEDVYEVITLDGAAFGTSRPPAASRSLLTATSTEASSTLVEGKLRHSAARLTDGNKGTAWSEGVGGQGIGQTVTVSWACEGGGLGAIGIWPGLASKGSSWSVNSRPRQAHATLVIDGEQALDTSLSFDNAMSEHFLDLRGIACGTSATLTLEIESVWEGKSYEDTCISEISLYAAHSGEGLGIPMVRVASGTYTLGSPSNEEARDKDEKVHAVTLSRPFLIGTTEVTQDQWEAVMGSNPSKFKGGDLPVENVTWFQAVEFANALSLMEGLEPAYRISQTAPTIEGKQVTWNRQANGYRLPTEAEWEVAARAGKRQRYAGSEVADPVGWHKGNSAGRTHAVGAKEPNGLGLRDMTGNVWEWCWDYEGDYVDVATDPSGPPRGTERIYRGGSWKEPDRYVRVANRGFYKPEVATPDKGLRVVRNAD